MTTAIEDLDRGDMQRLASGHDASLDALMERHGLRLFHYLLRITRNDDDAHELAQETFVRVYQHRTQYQPSRKFSTWLYAIATHLALDRLRRRQRHPEVPLDAPHPVSGQTLENTLTEARESPSDALITQERAQLVRNAIAALPEDLRTPLILAEYEDRSHADIGEILDCTPKAVEMRLYRARQALRQSLARWLGP